MGVHETLEKSLVRPWRACRLLLHTFLLHQSSLLPPGSPEGKGVRLHVRVLVHVCLTWNMSVLVSWLYSTITEWLLDSV